VRVATVDDDITLFEVGGQLIDEVIDSRAGFDEEDDLARALEFGNELFNRVSSLNVGAWMRVSVDDNGSKRGANVPLASFARK
jgi:hypothetical protein